MLETIVKFLSDRGTLVQPEALDYLSTLDEPMDRLKAGFRRGREFPFVLTLEHARKLTQPPGERDRSTEPRQLPEPTPVQDARAPSAGRRDEASSASASGSGSATASAAMAPPEPSDTAAAARADPEARQVDGQARAEQTRGTPSSSPASTGGSSEDTSSRSGPSKGSRQRASAPRTSSGGPGFKEAARRVAEEVKIELDITGESTCEGNIEDFTKLFRDRYNRMRRLFRRRREMVGATTVNRLKEGQPAKVVALVTDVKTTKNGHRILELEDDTGQTVALASKGEQRLIDLADTILLDEVVGISGKMARGRRGDDGLLIIDEIVRPDVPLDRKPNTAEGTVAFVSDVHIGADTFLSDPWDTLIDWLSERVARKPTDEGVRYLVIAGDLVEGVGIYPGQEDELHIPDVFDQYEAAADTLRRLPDELTILVQPGNHDAVRPAEPQPGFPEPIRELFAENVEFIGNPCYLSLQGVELLSYHGVSLIDYFEALPNCSIDKPIETMEEMLRRRHICPIYGGKTPLAPEHLDHLVIERIPDIFVTGHVHTARTGEYRGTRLINASTWQEQTDYQRMMGFDPDPCKAFEVDLSNLGVTTWAFDPDEQTGEVTVDQADVERTKVGAMAR